MPPHHAARPQLRLVAAGERCPKQQLAFLFAAEAQLERNLADVRLALQVSRERLAESEGSLVLPRMERLRTLYGPKADASTIRGRR